MHQNFEITPAIHTHTHTESTLYLLTISLFKIYRCRISFVIFTPNYFEHSKSTIFIALYPDDPEVPEVHSLAALVHGEGGLLEIMTLVRVRLEYITETS